MFGSTATAILTLPMTVSEINKMKVRLFIEAVLNDGRLELIDELVGDDYVGRVPHLEEIVRGPDGVRRLVASRRRDYPEVRLKIEDQIAEGDRVATLWRTADCSGISIIRLLAGKQVDSHTEYTESASR